jgi:phosphoglycerol transferase MdoB-like AlkP superfamily enzyme
LGTLVYQSIESSTALREPIDKAAIEHIAQLEVSHAGISPTSSEQQPDIIIIQSESFFDPSVLAGVGDTTELLPVLSRARKEGSVGQMIVPTFGGGTLRTEFETLTSIPLAAFPKIEFPYLQIHSKFVPSLVRTLKDAGYKAYAIHPNDANFWNRDQAFHSMGFDAFYSLKNFPANAAKDGWAVADSAFTTEIEKILGEGDHPVFIMGISMEGHGPYLENPVTDKVMRDSMSAPSTWPADAAREYRNYTYHIHHADQELGRLWNYLEQRGRPYILVFYGDHLPGFSKVYAAAGGFDDGQPARTQTVPWAMVSNMTLEMPDQPIYSWMTGGEILCSSGGKGNDYYSMIQKVRTYQVSRGMAFLDKPTLDGVDSLSRLYLHGSQMPTNIRESAKYSFCAPIRTIGP